MEEQRVAYLRAYWLLEAVQGPSGDAAVAELAAASVDASERGWDDVRLVLTAARVVHALTRNAGEPADALVGELMLQAEVLRAPALTALALGLRALAAGSAGDTAGLLRDAGRAVALLDDAELPDLDRCTAYVVVAASYNTLRLWELVDELYEQAVRLAPEPAAPDLVATVAVNRALTRLEWALARIEADGWGPAAEENPTLRVALERVDEAVRAAQRHPLPPIWAHDVQACSLVARLLLASEPAALRPEVDRLRRDLTADGDVETLPLLEAAWLLACSRKDGGSAARLATAPAVNASATSGARSFPLWVRAQVLAATAPTPAVHALQEHARLVSRLLWQSRLGLLTSARAQIAVERRHAEHERLTRDVQTDPLTGLLNRRSFDAWLNQDADGADPGTLVLVDVDDFKHVNDTYGHDVGDEVLRAVARLMRSLVRTGDLAIRHGGDEFAVVMGEPGLTPDAAYERAAALRSAVSDTDWSAVADGLAVTVSIGVAGAVALDGTLRPDATAVYRAADAALYAAKRAGTGCALAGSGQREA